MFRASKMTWSWGAQFPHLQERHCTCVWLETTYGYILGQCDVCNDCFYAARRIVSLWRAEEVSLLLKK